MSLKAKKLKMLEIIMAIKDEKLLDEISSKVIPLVPTNGKDSSQKLVEKYQTRIEPDFDLEKIIKEQKYEGYHPQKVAEIIKELNIEEPLEDLLKMI